MGEGGCKKSGKNADVVYGWSFRYPSLAMLFFFLSTSQDHCDLQDSLKDVDLLIICARM